MGTFYLTEPYCFVRKHSERLKIFKNNICVKEVKVNDFSRFFVHESTTLTTDALLLLAERGIDVVYFSGNRAVGRFVGPENKNVRLRIAQVQAHLSEERSFKIARNIVLAKIRNTRTSIQRFSRRRGLNLDSVILFLKELMKKCLEVDRLDLLRGIEGVAAKKYFEIFHLFIRSKDFSFNKRSRRPAHNEVNALLNYGYALLRSEITSSLFAAGLDPYIGFLHRERYGRESLALDLMEEFRCILVDNLVLKVINQGVIKTADFYFDHGVPRLKDHARKKFLKEFDQRRKDEVIHAILRKKMSYREILQKQALLLAKYLKGELEDYYPFIIR